MTFKNVFDHILQKLICSVVADNKDIGNCKHLGLNCCSEVSEEMPVYRALKDEL